MWLSLVGFVRAMTTCAVFLSSRPFVSSRCARITFYLNGIDENVYIEHGNREQIKIVHTSSHIAAHQVHLRFSIRASGTISIDFHSSNRAVNLRSAHLLMKKHESTHNWPNRRRQRKRFRSTFSISFMLGVGPRIRYCVWSPNAFEHFSRAISTHLFR